MRLKQLSLKNHYQNLPIELLPNISSTGLKCFSQFEEDGKLLFLFSLLGMDQKTFVEFGSDDGINSNSANLYFNHEFNGVFLDGNSKAIERGRYFFNKHRNLTGEPPVFVESMITAENINELIKSGGLEGEIGLLSIDIDGNDYWVWNALEQVSPNVVIIETHVEFGMRNIVVPYDPNYFFPGKHPVYHGASPIAMVNLAKKKGYRLVGANDLGFNFIFLKNGLADKDIPEVSVESVLTHPSVEESWKRFEPVKDWEFIEP